jgi:spore maturation protein SpmA/spore maturation protein SpmB
MNRIFVAMILIAFAVASFRQVQWTLVAQTDEATEALSAAEVARLSASTATEAAGAAVILAESGDLTAAASSLTEARTAAGEARAAAEQAAAIPAGESEVIAGATENATAAAAVAASAVDAAQAALAASDRPSIAPSPDGDPSLEGQLAEVTGWMTGQQVSERSAEIAALAVPELPARSAEPIKSFSDGLFDMAKAAVMSIVLPLIGAMAFFLGLMKVAEEAGLMGVFAKLLRPLMVRLFPDVPPDHPAMSAMILNMAANALGLGNAATPFGIKAMQELDKLNPEKGTATNAMCLFLAINTSSVTLLPTGVIAIRETLNSGDAAGILPTTLMATILSTSAAITAAKIYQRFSTAPSGTVESDERDEDAGTGYPLWVSMLAIGTLVAMVPVTVVYGSVFGKWIVPLIVAGFIGYGALRGVKVYEAFVAGAREGFDVGIKIVPFLVAILAAVGMLRGSGAIDLFVGAVGEWTMMVGLPAEVLPMALLRPLSGSGAYGVMMATLNDYGPDSFIGYLVSTLQGSTETTFYVLAVYFGAVGIQRTRHAMAAALTADAVGVMAATAACWVYFLANGMTI